MSKQGLCEQCAGLRLAANIEQMRTHSGPNFQLWRRNHAAAVGGVLLDDLLREG